LFSDWQTREAQYDIVIITSSVRAWVRGRYSACAQKLKNCQFFYPTGATINKRQAN